MFRPQIYLTPSQKKSRPPPFLDISEERTVRPGSHRRHGQWTHPALPRHLRFPERQREGARYVIGDAADIPTSKAGSVAHFEAEILLENVLSYIEGRSLTAQFDGHANCYIETGYGKGALIDFNYETEPLPGTFPFPGVGPFGLLKNTKMNHYGKLLFRWIYWHMLLKGKELPIEAEMSMAGKIKV